MFEFKLSVEDGSRPEIAIQANGASDTEIKVAVALIEASLRRIKEHSMKKFGTGQIINEDGEARPAPTDDERAEAARRIAEESKRPGEK